MPSIKCSWLTTDTPTFYKEIQIIEEPAEALQAAEVSMSLAAESVYDANNGDKLENPETAPFVELELNAAITAICMTSNAKSVEIQKPDGTLLGTFQASAEVNGWYQHFLVSNAAAGEPLLPPGVRVSLKFFARRPREYINIATLCVVHGEPPKSPLMETDAKEFRSHSTEAQLKKLYDGVNQLQNQLLKNMEMVNRRLDRVDARLDQIENRINSK
ncbi:hypothetical protein AGDE_13661 [Angomonas deanei]|uniref:Uncharacterized protein n=1 Tax=Angomonas deanei TaxID=59799 RepID=A0A7G2CJU8_9TRYP|nr:hypothetical protein AGDE_13661 [Angomonas deanei]CAD2220138.1 hypothetical protein, conserved [Angomonas deanei]|eukprot:EPY21990.1 hypothetical protein AGDE_13661 [Angomonas deanei]